jgi:NitT/TauT family transport system substrate-binding protein
MRGKHGVAATLAVAALLAVAAGCGEDSSSGSGAAGGAKGTETVKMGTVRGSSADAAVFIAIEKGFFAKQGVKVQLEEFNTGAQYVAPLGSGQLDAGSGGISAGLMNAVASGVGIKMVAAKSEIGRPSYTSLLVRKQYVDSGRYKDFSDLKGMKVAIPALGVPPHYELSLFLKQAGLSIKDVRLEQLGFADMVPALQNGSVDAAIAIEPSATLAVRSGGAKKVAGTDEVFPGEQSAAIMFGDRFIKDRPEVAQKVMNAYLEAVRFYLSAIKDARLQGPRGEEIARILTKHTAVKDPKVYLQIPLHIVPPDLALNKEYIQRELDFWHEQDLIKTDFDVSDAIDMSFAEKAVAELGPAQESR